MFPDCFTRAAARVVLVSYITQLFAPIYACEKAEQPTNPLARQQGFSTKPFKGELAEIQRLLQETKEPLLQEELDEISNILKKVKDPALQSSTPPLTQKKAPSGIQPDAYRPVFSTEPSKGELLNALRGLLKKAEESAPHCKTVATPFEARAEAQEVIDAFLQERMVGSPSSFLQSEAFQYCLSVDTLNSAEEKFQLKLSRKAKGSNGSFERLLTATVKGGKLASSIPSTIKEAQKDTLLTLFQGAFVHKGIEPGTEDTVCLAYSIPGFGTLKLGSKGSVFLDQDSSAPILSSYDLVLKTTGTLFIETLGVAALTLKSKASKILGAVSTNRLHADHEVVNMGGLHVREQLTGPGQVINQGIAHMEGTKEKPALLEVREFINRKSDIYPLTTKVESSHLHVTAKNQSFLNGKDAEFRAETLIVDPITQGSFTNKGNIYLGTSTINRQASNAGFWQAHQMTVNEKPFTNTENLNILDQLTVTSHLLNEGDIDAKNLIKMTRGQNKGTIKGEALELHVADELINEGQVSINKLWGEGTFKNHRELKFLGNHASAHIHHLHNQTKAKSFSAQIKGSSVGFYHNKSFVNDVNSDVLIDNIWLWGKQAYPLTESTIETKESASPSLKNLGTIKSESFLASKGIFENGGTIETATLKTQKGKFHNLEDGNLQVRGNTDVEESIFQNDGKMRTEKGKYGQSKFTQDKGKFYNTGRWEHTGDVDLGSTDLNNSGTLIWQKGTWNASGQKYYYNLGNWTLDQMVCPQALRINNFKVLHLKNSTLTFESLRNHRNLIVSGGQYSVESLSNKDSIRFQDQSCAFKVDTFDNEGEIQVAQSITQAIKLDAGTNTGKINGINLALDIQKSLTNAGEVTLQDLIGSGKFTNKGKLQLTGEAQAPSQIGIQEFENGTNDAETRKKPTLAKTSPSTPAQIKGLHVVVAPTNKKFITHSNSEIVGKSLIFARGLTVGTRRPTPPTPLEIKGKIHADILEIYRPDIFNSGTLQALYFSVHGGKFRNATKALLHVGKAINADVFLFHNEGMMAVDQGKFTQKTGEFFNTGEWKHTGDIDLGSTIVRNQGKLVVTQGKFTQKNGEFINTGRWDHTGDIDLGSTTLRNENGTLVWQKGAWTFSPQGKSSPLFVNHGNWSLDQMACSQLLNIQNHGGLYLKAGSLDFGDLINHKILEVSGGRYQFFSSFMNHHVLRLLNHDWTFTEGNNTNVRLQPGKIECQKSYTHDVQALPESIRAEGDVIFSRRHAMRRTLADLAKVTTPGKVTFYCSGGSTNPFRRVSSPSDLTTTRHYEFSNIGYLDLIVDGPFTIRHSFKARALSLNVNGPLTCGASNDVISTIAATNGPLNITAHSIDNRFGKIYGRGPTTLKSTRGDILNGAAISKGPYLYGMNGSYIASGSTLEIQTPQEFKNQYGKVISYKRQLIKALAKITNIAGEIHGLDDIYIDTPNFSNSRDSTYAQQVGDWTWAYHDCYACLESSDQALMQSMGSIYFSVDQGNNLASSILATKDIFYKPFSNSRFLSQKPASFRSEGRVLYGYGHIDKPWGQRHQGNVTSNKPSTLMSGQSIQISTGDVVISGTMNSPIVKVEATQALFHNTNRTRQTVNTTTALLIDLTKFIQAQVPISGFFYLTNKGEVKTEHPLGKPYVSKDMPSLMFVNDENKHLYKNLDNIKMSLDPLQGLSFGQMNLFLQQVFSENLGKVYVGNAKGKNATKQLLADTAQVSKEIGKTLVTLDDLQNIHRALILYGLQQIGNMIQWQTFVFTPPEEINPYQSSGDISCDEGYFETSGKQEHLNNRIVGKDMLRFTAESIERRTQKYTTTHTEGQTTIVQERAMPQQQWICTQGDVVSEAKGDSLSEATHTEAGRDILEVAGDSITHQEQVLNTTITHTEEDEGFTSSTTTTHSTSSNEILPNTRKAGRQIISKAGQEIRLSGDKENGQVLTYDAPSLIAKAAVAINTSSITTDRNGACSDSRAVSMSESSTVCPVEFNGLIMNAKAKKAVFSGADFAVLILNDHTDTGMEFRPEVWQQKYFAQVVTDTPLSHSDVGCEGWYEVMQPCRLAINKIIRHIDTKVDPKTYSPITLADSNNPRFVHPMPGDENSCGFYALLTGQPDFNMGQDDPRQLAVQKLLEGLHDETLQPQICALLAPEIWELLIIEDELKFIPEADAIFNNHTLAYGKLNEAVSVANTALGVGGKEAKDILAYTPETLRAAGGNPGYLEGFQQSVRKAFEHLNAMEAEEIAFAHDPETVAAFIKHKVAESGWELGYSSEYYNHMHAGEGDQKPSGVMDAIALVLGVNLKIYRLVKENPNQPQNQPKDHVSDQPQGQLQDQPAEQEAKDVKEQEQPRLTLVHTKEVSENAPTLELYHKPFIEGASYNNHFDRLELTPLIPAPAKEDEAREDKGVIKLESVIWDKNRTEIIGKFAETTYELKKWHTEWAIHEQAIPDEALVVVALAIGIATQGWGASFAANTLGLGTIGSEVFAAGFASMCTQVGTSFLKDGDPFNAVSSLFSDHYLRSLGTSLATVGLVGGGGSVGGFTQRLLANGLRSVVKASVSSVIEKRDIGDALKDGAIGALVDSISGSIAEKIGEAASAKINPLTPIEHKLAHFALGAGMGAVLDRDDPLAGAITSGAGAVIGEMVAESLVDREQIKREVSQEMEEKGVSFQEACRRKLQPYIDISRLVAGAVIAATGRDPSLAIYAATNALENNCIPSLTKSLLASEGVLPQKDAEEFWQDEYDDPDDLYLEMVREEAQEKRGRSETHSRTRPLIDPKTYNPIQAAHENTLEEFVQDRLEFDEYQKGSSLSPRTRHRLTQRHSTTYYAFREMESHKELIIPGYKRFEWMSNLSLEELKAERMQEMDPQGRFSSKERAAAEKIIKNEFEHYQGQKLTLAIGAVLPFAAGKMAPSMARVNRGGTPHKPAPQKETGTVSSGKSTPSKLSKDQPWKIRLGQEWKEKVVGKAQKTGTPGHALESAKQAIREAKDPVIGKVYLNNGYHKALKEHGVTTKLESNRIPDVLAVSKDGKKMRSTEIQSKSDDARKLEGRNLKVRDQLKPNGITLDVDVKKIPTWDYEKGLRKQ